nr:hypothetical protein [Tanacetum cinerariifolium]
MKMEQYLAHTDYALWEVILNGNSTVQMTKDEAGNEVKVTPITTQQILARTRERKAKSTLLMAILDERLARFHGIKYAKTLWAIIKTRFDGNKSRDAGNAGYKGREEEGTDFALMAFTLNPSSFLSSNSEDKEVTETVIDNRLSDKENSPSYYRFKKGKGYHAVPPPLIGKYMPPKSDLSFARLDDSIYKFKISETVTSLTKDEKDALETSTAFVEKTKEVKTSAPLIQD